MLSLRKTAMTLGMHKPWLAPKHCQHQLHITTYNGTPFAIAYQYVAWLYLFDIQWYRAPRCMKLSCP